ncbi:MAG: PAS domain-containing sensor histidine kinase [Sulfuricellaceae bacterium]
MNPNLFEEKRRHAQLRAEAEAQLTHVPAPQTPLSSADELAHELHVHQIELEMQNEELRRTQAALETSRDRYLDLYAFAPVGYLTLSCEGAVSEINLTGAALLGGEHKKLLRCRFDSLVAAEDRERWYHLFVGMMKQEIGRNKIELGMKRSDGSVFHARLDCLLVVQDDTPPAVRITLADIDELKQTEKKLRASNERVNLLLASTGEGIYAVDEKGVCIIANPACARLLGYATSDELLGRDMHGLMHYRHEDGSAFPVEACPVHTVFRTARPAHQIEELFWRADGSPLPVALSAYPMHREGAVVGAVVSFNDITERKRKDNALRNSESRFRNLVETTSDWIWEVDTHAVYTYASPKIHDILGYLPEEVLGKTPFDLMPATEAQRVADLFDAIVATRAPIANLENINLHKDGHPITLESSGVPIVDEQGIFRGYRGVDRDITARKQAEAQLRLLNESLEQRILDESKKSREKDLLLIQQSRLAAIGEVIHNVSHHWRQPLSAVSLILANIKDTYEFNELSQEYLDREVAGGQRLIREMSETIDRFRDIFTPDGEKQAFRVCDTLEEAICLLAPAFEAGNIDIDFEPRREALVVSGYPADYSRVLMNVLTNARDAIARSNVAGEIRIKLEKGDEAATVSILDNGGGIPADTLERIFDPYFTTKEGGTGLGLYLAKTIMDNMGGGIEIRNFGEGVEVQLALPLAKPERSVSAEESP